MRKIWKENSGLKCKGELIMALFILCCSDMINPPFGFGLVIDYIVGEDKFPNLISLNTEILARIDCQLTIEEFESIPSVQLLNRNQYPSYQPSDIIIIPLGFYTYIHIQFKKG